MPGEPWSLTRLLREDAGPRGRSCGACMWRFWITGCCVICGPIAPRSRRGMARQPATALAVGAPESQGFRSVISLRGKPIQPRSGLEAEICADLGLPLLTPGCSPRAEFACGTANALVAFSGAPRPVYMHCNPGRIAPGSPLPSI